MAITPLMSWVKAGRRWLKQYKGKTYAISCRQLGVGETKEDSAAAANAWWRAKQAELDGPEPPTDAEIDREAGRRNWEVVWATLGKADPDTKALFQRLLAPKAVPGGTIGERVAKFLEHKERQKSVGELSPGLLQSHKRYMERFAEFMGREQSLTTISAERWEAWYMHLRQQVAEKQYSESTIFHCYWCSKQFIFREAELGMITLPATIRSRRLAFSQVKPVIDPFTVEEVRELLAASRERTRLFMLLMLNCGFTQKDISDLKPSEVDLRRGYITRKRSKRQRYKSAIVVSWTLWPETVRLLKKHRSKSPEHFLTSEKGSPLVVQTEHDLIGDAFRKVQKKTGITKPLKAFRKTAASELYKEPTYSRFAQYFLAQEPSEVADTNYIKPAQEQLDEAIIWLGKRYGF